ncbi:ribosome maturation factor RimP [Schaalia sp. lx-260]|uniref:ribosome maturation factor RimP n=1 Tax=Schaalia sp. lx-260 TaxID=2899082 RepID=UPI001E4C6C64|nr:ribosome maturation factor RimP [Schaalia sp. lx-260]
MGKPQPDENLYNLLRPIVAEQGVELDAVVLTSQYGMTLLRVTVEEPEGEQSLDADTLADVSRIVSAALDKADPIEQEYLLEVSTPGIDRLLLQPAHWRRQMGRTVAGRLYDGQRFAGRVCAVDDVYVTLEVEGEKTTFDYAQIKKARAQVELTATDQGNEE